MEFNFIKAISQSSHLQTLAVRLREPEHLLRNFQRCINQNWQGPEMHGVNVSVENTINRLRTLSTELELIARDIHIAAETIKEKEAIL